MKDFVQSIAWGLNRFIKVFGNLFSLIVRSRTSVESKRVMCWAYNFKQYSCNPRYLTEYLLENNPEFEIYWVFRKNIDISGIDKRIKCVRFRSIRYYILVNTAEFLITNSRTDPYRIYWKKRPEQKYLMLWHGGVALKRIEKDAGKKLSYSYRRKALLDSSICDLMISGCRFQTYLLKNSFWYDGEILEKGIPRNDIFFKTSMHEEFRKKVFKHYGIAEDNKVILYAPTFRTDRSIEPYKIDWSETIKALEKVYHGSGITVLLRLHPNLIGKTDTTPLLNDPRVMDATGYHDMQELLCISDMLITDYSSSMFDITMLKKPCLLYATDIEKYDRGYYFKFTELPFPLARNQEELEHNIKTFDIEKYRNDVECFFDRNIGLCEDGNASKELASWIKERSLIQHT